MNCIGICLRKFKPMDETKDSNNRKIAHTT